MHAPQIIYISILAANLGVSIAKHGESQGKYNFFITAVASALTVCILKWGGFFG